MAGARIDDLALALGRERALAERDREDLVRPEFVVIVCVGRVDDVIAVSGALIPETTESSFHARGELVHGLEGCLSRFAKPAIERSALYQSALISTALPSVA